MRTGADIVYEAGNGKERVIELVRKLAPTKELRETHAHLDVFEDVEVEAHYRPELV